MNTYLVKLKLQIGEYEKSSVSLVDAATSSIAIEQALQGECHGAIEDGTAHWSDGGIFDLGGEFHYSVSSCELVNAEHVAVMKNYLNFHVAEPIGFAGTRGSMTIIANDTYHLFHFCDAALSGLEHEAWYPFEQGALLQSVERYLVSVGIAHNVTSIMPLRQCGDATDYHVIYNRGIQIP